ncbi:hexapeptide transferase [Vibrio galatheae]|uniref:Hexapeptide transferase n=1 Tax=Vibrio galatheae TaxID=579748 RepID=A0A0F4NLT7_9VIBR|nr:acyltransferase [Vibrio galatheae]KJY84145.1 hexapeptide transferase [Vibrio galatheae]
MAHFSLRLRNKIRIGSGNTVEIGEKTRIRYCDIHVTGSGNKLVFKDGANLKGVCIELDGNDCTLIIGKDCVIGENCFISCRERGTQLTIGDNCMFSRNVKVMTSDGHNILKQDQRINPAKSIHIGDNVWLADNVTVLKGASIGNGSVVGINSTLTKSINQNVVAVGNPARVIQEGSTWENELTY